MSPLKILHVLDHSLPVHSGYAFRSQAIFAAQKRRGWEPVVLTSPKHYESWHGPWVGQEQVGDFMYCRSSPVSKSSLPLHTEMRIMAAVERQLFKVAKREKPHVLHAHSPILNAIPTLWVSRKLGIPMVYEMRALWEDAAVDHGTYGEGSWKYRLVRAIEAWVCHRADHIAVLCNGLRKDLVERGIRAEKLTIIPNGVDVEAFRIGQPDRSLVSRWNLSGKKVVGFIGSFFRYEGLDLLIDAFAHLVRSRSDVSLLLLGGGETEDELKAQIKRLRLDEKVVMPGAIPHERVPDVYAQIDILVYPRRSMRLTELVTPLKPLEAMAMGKAVLASDVGGHRELIRHGETGLLFRAGDTSALAETLQRVLDDVLLRTELGRQGLDWVRRERSWDATTAGYTEVYTTVQRNGLAYRQHSELAEEGKFKI
jgi:PEP-CTERM/exosortase A-associated glycosyltransferase